MFRIVCFCVDVKHKSREILHGIVYTCKLLSVLEHCVFWQLDNSNHPVIMLKNWDTACNMRFQLDISFGAVQCFLFKTWVPQCSQETFSFPIREGIFVINRII